MNADLLRQALMERLRGVPQGLLNDPMAAMSNPTTAAAASGAAQNAPQMPVQALSAMANPTPAPMAPARPAPAPGAGMGDFLSQAGNALGDILMPNRAAKSKTIGWLTSQGMDEGTASLLAGNKDALQKYLLSRSMGADPKSVLELEKMRLEIEGMRNPDPEYITGRDGSIFRASNEGLEQVYGGKPDPTTDIQNYEYYVQQERTAGRDPLPMHQWKSELSRAGATNVNVDTRAEGAFEKKLAENQATVFMDMAKEGYNARADLAVLGELESLLGSRGGSLDGLSSILAKYGIGGEGMSDIQAAQALINKLVPTQRQPGSGTMSDRDVELFTRSLPNLWNTPEGNQKIIRVMRGLAEYKRMQGEIAANVLSGTMTRQEATEELRTLPNPLAEFNETGKQGQSGSDASDPDLDKLLKMYGD